MRSRASSNASLHSLSEIGDTYQIFVKLVSGETIPLQIPSSTTIPTLLQLLSLRTSLPAASLRLVHVGKHLPLTSATATLASLHIPPSSTIDVTLPLRGGMPTRKVRCGHKDCREPAQRIVGDCSFCNGHYCGKHRMLEDHKCTGLEDCKKESHERNANKLNSERTIVVKGI